MDIKIRDVDAAAIAKIDELAKKKGLSRNEFLKRCISTFAISQEVIDLDQKYHDLIDVLADRLEQANDVIAENTEILKKISNK